MIAFYHFNCKNYPYFVNLHKIVTMAEIHITGIQYVEINAEEGLEFKYKPEVPKLKLVGTFLTQKVRMKKKGFCS